MYIERMFNKSWIQFDTDTVVLVGSSTNTADKVLNGFRCKFSGLLRCPWRVRRRSWTKSYRQRVSATKPNTWNACIIQNMSLIGSRHNIMHSESGENVMLSLKNCYHHHNINVKNQIGMHNMEAPLWSHFPCMRIIHNTHSMYLWCICGVRRKKHCYRWGMVRSDAFR